MALPDLEGPYASPLSGKPAKQLVVLLHGLGADGNDLFGLAPYFAETLPDAAFISPNAPFPCDMAPFGYQWFSLQNRDPHVMLSEIQKSAPILDRFLDRQLKKHGLDDSALALIGFSQGTMMSLYTAPRRKAACAGILGYSGALIGVDTLSDKKATRMPIRLIHGDSDSVVPSESMAYASEALENKRFDVSSHVISGLGHSIDEAGLELGMEFLKEIFVNK